MVSGELAGEGLQTGFSRHGLPPSESLAGHGLLTFFHADFGKEFPSRTLWRGPSRDCHSPSSVLCPLLYRTEHFSRGRKGWKITEKRWGRGVASKGGKKEKRTRENRSVYPLREHLNSVQGMVSGGYCVTEGLFPDTVCWTRLRNTWVFSATRTPNSHNHSYLHYSLCKFTGEWFTNHSNHIHRFTPITRIVATDVASFFFSFLIIIIILFCFVFFFLSLSLSQRAPNLRMDTVKKHMDSHFEALIFVLGSHERTRQEKGLSQPRTVHNPLKGPRRTKNTRVCKPWFPNRGSRLPAEQRLNWGKI